MAMNTKSDSLTSILATKHPARPSNEVDNDVVADHAAYEYSWEGRVLDSRANPIPKEGNVFKPVNDDQVAILEHLVTSGIVIKTIEE